MVSPAAAPLIAAWRSPLAATSIVVARGVPSSAEPPGAGAPLGGRLVTGPPGGGVQRVFLPAGCGDPFNRMAGSPKKIHDLRRSGFVTTRLAAATASPIV